MSKGAVMAAAAAAFAATAAEAFVATPAAPAAPAAVQRQTQVSVAVSSSSAKGSAAGSSSVSAAGAAMAMVATAGALARRPQKARAHKVVVAAGKEPVKDSFMWAQVGQLVKGSPVILFSKTTCPFCAAAKKAFDDVGAQYKLVELDKLGAGAADEVQDVLQELSGGSRTVPQVFVGGECIGGGDDTVALKESGELKKLVDAAKADFAGSLQGKDVSLMAKDDDEWQKELDPGMYRILRQRGTEPPNSHPYARDYLPEKGHFTCSGCNLPLYSAASKFQSNCGWPVFDKVYSSDEYGQHVDSRPDGSGSLEILCKRCGGHMGHVFYDAVSATNPNGERH